MFWLRRKVSPTDSTQFQLHSRLVREAFTSISPSTDEGDHWIPSWEAPTEVTPLASAARTWIYLLFILVCTLYLYTLALGSAYFRCFQYAIAAEKLALILLSQCFPTYKWLIHTVSSSLGYFLCMLQGTIITRQTRRIRLNTAVPQK